jgi:hypothetical protein
MKLNLNIPQGTISQFGTGQWKLSNEKNVYTWTNNRPTTKGMILHKTLNNTNFLKSLSDKISFNQLSIKQLLDLEARYETSDVFYLLYHDENGNPKNTVITLDTGTLKAHNLSSILNAIVIKMDNKLHNF